MEHYRTIRCLALSLLSFLLLVGCHAQATPEQFQALLLRQLDQAHSYQADFRLECAGQDLLLRQWYRAPGLLRTDVLEDNQATFRFIYDQTTLRVVHLASGQQQQVALTAGNELFVSPLMLDCCRQASQSTWRPAGERAYVSDFTWTATDNQQKNGRLTVDAVTLLPLELELIWPDQELVRITLQQMLLNPTLDEALFSETGR